MGKELIKYVEEKFGVSYIGYYDLPKVDGVHVFWQPEPKTELGHSNYLGVIDQTYIKGSILLINGISITEAEYNAIELEAGKYIVSRFRHDYQEGTNAEGLDVMVDGGLEYTRRSGKITHKMKVIEGKEVYIEV